MANQTTNPEVSDSIRDRLQETSEHSIFHDKRILDPETIIDEDRIVGRDKQLDRIIKNLRPALDEDPIPNMILYGPSGTGKSLIVNAVSDQVKELSRAQGIRFGVVQVNLQTIKSHDRAVFRLVQSAAREAGMDPGVPETGVATDQKLDRFYEILSEGFDSVLVILDEIDLLVGADYNPDTERAYSKLLYQLSRASTIDRRIDGDVSVAAITNDPSFMDNLDGRAESSFDPIDIPFSDYDAEQLRSILDRRRDAYHEGVLSEDVIPLSAALGAQDHGDARKAIDLFRLAGEVAKQNGSDVVTETHVRNAQDEAERDRVITQMKNLSTHKRLSLYSTAAVAKYASRDMDGIPSTISYNVYKFLTNVFELEPKARDTYLRYMSEASTYNFVTKDERGRGFGRGVHNEYSLVPSPNVAVSALEDTLELWGEVDEQEFTTTINREVSNFFEKID